MKTAPVTSAEVNHEWEGDHCVKCGDADWYARPICSECKIKPQSDDVQSVVDEQLDATQNHINHACNDVLLIIQGYDCGERLTREDVIRLAKSVDASMQEAQRTHDELRKDNEIYRAMLAASQQAKE